MARPNSGIAAPGSAAEEVARKACRTPVRRERRNRLAGMAQVDIFEHEASYFIPRPASGEHTMAKKRRAEGGCPRRSEIHHSLTTLRALSPAGAEHLRKSTEAAGVELPVPARGQRFFQCSGCDAVWLATSEREKIAKQVLGVWNHASFEFYAGCKAARND